MKRLILLVALLLGLPLSAFAQAQQRKLPTCPTVDYSKKTDAGKTAKWNKCFGKIVIEFDEYSKGDVYEGEYNNGKLNGLGTHKYVSGNIYTGMFKDGNYHGQGTLISADGIKFAGNYKDGRRNGYGIEKYEVDGSTKNEGIWDGFELVEAKSKKTFTQEKQIDNKNLDFFVIQPQFNGAQNFQEGLALVRIGDDKTGKCGFIDKQGKFVINPQFDEARDFRDGLAAFAIGRGASAKWGFINKQGKIVIKPQFDYALDFQEGLAAVLKGDYATGKWGFIDKNGEFIIKPNFDFVDGFNDEIAAVRIGDDKTGKWGFIDKNDEFIIKPQFDYAFKFQEGLALVLIGNSEFGKWGFVDKKGKFIINPQFGDANLFQEGLAKVLVPGEKSIKYSFINKQGEIITKQRFDLALGFQEGLAAVKVGNDKTGKWGFIDKQGKFVIQPQFSSSNNFQDGLAAVKVGNDKTGKWGFIDKQGKLVIRPQFYDTYNFQSGFAAVQIGDSETGKWGFITKELGRSSKLAALSPEQKNTDGNKQQSSKLSLQTTTTNPDVNGSVTITIRTNADTSSLKVNGEEQGGRPDGNYTIKRVARVGQDTQFTITATDINGNADSKTISVSRKTVESAAVTASLNPENIKTKSSRDAVAVIIGISTYKSLPRADFAKDDAQVFYDYAIRALGVKPENIKLLLDADAEEVEIFKAFKTWLPARVKSTTDVYVFYSGHGLPTADGLGLYLLPYRADRDLISKTAVQFQEINMDIQAAKPKSVTIFMDACYSGQARGGETLIASARPLAIKAQTTIFPSSFTVFSASQSDQISSSSPELKHGIFSYYLMKGMEGDADANKDGRITLGEMQGYLAENVGRQAGMMNRKQEPQLIGDVNKVLVVR